MENAEKNSRIKRRVMYILATLLVAGFVAVVSDPTEVVVGKLFGDAFFDGRPTRFWSKQLSSGPAELADAEEKLKAGGSEAVPVLMEILQGSKSDKNAEKRWKVAEILTKLGPDAAAAGPLMVAGLGDADPHVQAVCAAGLSKVGVPAATAVPLLTELLKSPNSVVIARALSDYRAAAAPALPVLIELLEDKTKSTETRWNAARTIGKIGPPALSAVPVLIANLDDKEATIREHSAEAIGDIGPTAVEGIPKLIEALSDSDQRVRRDAVRSLGYFGSAARSALPEIRKLLNDKVPRVKEATVTALKAISPDEVIPAEPVTSGEAVKTPK